MAQAIRSLVMGSDGRYRVSIVDAQTGLPVEDLASYGGNITGGSAPLPVVGAQGGPAALQTDTGTVQEQVAQPLQEQSRYEMIQQGGGEGMNRQPSTPVADNAYNADGTPNRMGAKIAGMATGMVGGTLGAVGGGLVGGPIGAAVGGLLGRQLASNSRLGDKLSPNGQLYGWGIGQPKAEAVIAEIDKENAEKNNTPGAGIRTDRATTISEGAAPVGGVQRTSLNPVGANMQANADRATVPSFDSLSEDLDSYERGDITSEQLGNTPQARPASTQFGRPAAVNTDTDFTSNRANVSYSLGDKRPHRPDLGLVDRVSAAIGSSLPGYGVNVTSGLGEYGSDRHRAKNADLGAFDFNLVDPQGQTITPASHPKEYETALRSLGQYDLKGLGHYGWGLHADMVRENSWGPTTGLASLNPTFGRAIEEGRAMASPYEGWAGPAVPTPRDTAIDNNIVDNLNAPIDRPQMGLDRFKTAPDFSQMTPGQIAFSGFGDIPDDQTIDSMAVTIAGELGPSTLRGLKEGRPEARQELANVVATMDNRMRTAGVANISNPSQYNSLMDRNMPTTRENYSLYGADITSAIRDTYAGENMPSNPDATHYANLSISNPGWAGSMQDAEKVGSHTFGNMPREYKTPSEERDAMAERASSRYNTQKEQAHARNFNEGLQEDRRTHDPDKSATEMARALNEDQKSQAAQQAQTAARSKASTAGLGMSAFNSLSFSGGLIGATADKTSAKDKSEAKDSKDSESKDTSKDNDSSKDGGKSSGGKGGSDSSDKGNQNTSSGKSKDSGKGLGSSSKSKDNDNDNSSSGGKSSGGGKKK